jgi:hypothetical protein
MPKLHELLAVEGDLDGLFKKILGETINTFSKKSHLFDGRIRTLHLFDDEAPEVAPEREELDTTVDRKIDYMKGAVVRYLDAVLQKEQTNQEAKADLVLPDGTTLATNVPATFLLGLETKLKLLRQVYETIPTLPPSTEWEVDESQGPDVFKTKYPEETFKTEKAFKVQILYEATKEHPAQVEKIPVTKNAGRFTTTNWSGKVSPARKSILMDRLDTLIRATKKARQRANATDVKKGNIGKVLLDYINA